MSRAVRRWPTAAALLIVGFLAGGGRATLYDGVGFPDEPYRYVGGVRTALTGLLPSLVPIAFGYLAAHNAAYLLVNSQLMLPLLGNPAGMQSWPVHLPYPFNDSYEPDHTFLPSAFYWYLGVVVIVAVHVVAVVLAHLHLAVSARNQRRARRSEYPWLVAMVTYTALSLYLIAQPLVQEKDPGAAKPAATAPATAVTRTSSK